MKTINAQLKSYSRDINGYINYVFKNLDNKEYIMCVRFPNWDNLPFAINDVGKLTYKEIKAGSEWSEGNRYRNTFIQFIRFTLKTEDEYEEIIF